MARCFLHKTLFQQIYAHSILNKTKLLNFLKETILHLMFNKNDVLKILLFQDFRGLNAPKAGCYAALPSRGLQGQLQG